MTNQSSVSLIIDQSQDRNYLVSSGQDGEVNFWDAKDGAHVECYEGAGRIMLALWNHSGDKVK